MDNSHMYDPCAVAVAVEHLKREQQDWSALAVTAALDEIARLDSKLADAIRERDEAIAVAVWAARVGACVSIGGTRIYYEPDQHIDHDGTDADIYRALRRDKARLDWILDDDFARYDPRRKEYWDRIDTREDIDGFVAAKEA